MQTRGALCWEDEWVDGPLGCPGAAVLPLGFHLPSPPPLQESTIHHSWPPDHLVVHQKAFHQFFYQLGNHRMNFEQIWQLLNNFPEDFLAGFLVAWGNKKPGAQALGGKEGGAAHAQ